MEQKKLDRINELAKKKKEGTLTEEEAAEIYRIVVNLGLHPIIAIEIGIRGRRGTGEYFVGIKCHKLIQIAVGICNFYPEVFADFATPLRTESVTHHIFVVIGIHCMGQTELFKVGFAFDLLCSSTGLAQSGQKHGG